MNLHFIRPELLWLLPMIIPLLLLAWRKQVKGGDWAKAIDPNLLPHLITTEGGGSRLRQLWWLTLPLLLIGASPLWNVLNRLYLRNRMRWSLCSISADRCGRPIPAKSHSSSATESDGHSGCSARASPAWWYAGDAHVVTPLTDDTRTIENLPGALAPDLVPLQGSNATEAITLASGLLETGLTNGSVLLITDGLPKFETSRVEGLLDSVGAGFGYSGHGNRDRRSDTTRWWFFARRQ